MNISAIKETEVICKINTQKSTRKERNVNVPEHYSFFVILLFSSVLNHYCALVIESPEENEKEIYF